MVRAFRQRAQYSKAVSPLAVLVAAIAKSAAYDDYQSFRGARSSAGAAANVSTEAGKEPEKNMKKVELDRTSQEFFTIKDVASMFRVSERTVRSWIMRRQLTVARLGRIVRISRVDIEEFIALMNQSE